MWIVWLVLITEPRFNIICKHRFKQIGLDPDLAGWLWLRRKRGGWEETRSTRTMKPLGNEPRGRREKNGHWQVCSGWCAGWVKFTGTWFWPGISWLEQLSYRATFGLDKNFVQTVDEERGSLTNQQEGKLSACLHVAYDSSHANTVYLPQCSHGVNKHCLPYSGLCLSFSSCSHFTGFTEANYQTRRQCENELSHRGRMLMLGCWGRS